MITDINDRVSWLSYRADWRMRYKEISQKIRARRLEIAEHRRKRREFGLSADHHRHAADGLQCGLWVMRRDANALMGELGEAKERKAALIAARDEAKPLAA